MRDDGRRHVRLYWSLLWASFASCFLFPPARSAAQLYENALPPAEVREYYYTDDSGFVYRGGITLRDPFGVHGKTGTVAELSLNADRDLCSMTGLWGNYQALFNLEILEDAFIGLVNNVAEAAIWTAFCSTEPVLCDLVKHMRAMARAGLQARLAQCGKVQDAAVEYGKDIWRESHKQCLEQKKAEGLSLDQAMEACGAHNVPVVNFAGTPCGAVGSDRCRAQNHQCAARVADVSQRGVGRSDVLGQRQHHPHRPCAGARGSEVRADGGGERSRRSATAQSHS